MLRMYFFPVGEVLRGLNRSAWTHWHGLVGWSLLGARVLEFVGCEFVGCEGCSVLMHLTMVVTLDVCCYDSIHVGPIVTLGSSLLGFLRLSCLAKR